jgi:hypothetical protein
MNYATQFQAHEAAAVARARMAYLMGGGSWSIPCNVTTFGHKPLPRWSQVTIS